MPAQFCFCSQGVQARLTGMKHCRALGRKELHQLECRKKQPYPRQFSVKQLSFIGGNKDYITLGRACRGWGDERTLLAGAKVLERLHLPEEEFQELAEHVLIGKEGVKPVIWSPGYMTTRWQWGGSYSLYVLGHASPEQGGNRPSPEGLGTISGSGRTSTSLLLQTGSQISPPFVL